MKAWKNMWSTSSSPPSSHVVMNMERFNESSAKTNAKCIECSSKTYLGLIKIMSRMRWKPEILPYSVPNNVLLVW